MPALIAKTAAECKRLAAISVENSIRQKFLKIATTVPLFEAACSGGVC
jgi:hypothetical protein